MIKHVGYGLTARLAVVLLLCASVMASDSPSQEKQEGPISLIEKAFATGKITLGDRIFYDFQAVRAPQDLPATLASSSAELVKCGTPYVNNILENWALLTPDQQAKATQYLARPSTDSVYISQSGAFAIHYNLTGPESVPSGDLNNNQIPDYVERIGEYADFSYHRYHKDMGYLPHPHDADSLYDIYLLRIGAYGITVVELPGDSAWDDYSSYIQIHCTFGTTFPPNDDPEGSVIGDQKVTCAHEYFHATQLAYDAFADAWWRESSATYFEEFIYPEVNDNYNYLPYFFNRPDTFLTSNNYHMYGAFVWPQYLTERFGVDMIRYIWEACRYNTTLAAIDSGLAHFGQSTKTVFPEFAVWDYFTGPRRVLGSRSYDSSAYYPLVPFDRVIAASPFANVSAVFPPDGLSSNYIMTYPDTTNRGLLKINFDGSNNVEWGFSYLTFQNGQISIYSGVPVDIQGRTDCGIYDFTRYDSVVFVPAVISQWLDNNQYVFNTVINPFGDVNGSGDLNLLDITYLVSYLYKKGPAPKYNLYMGDANCGGTVNILDITYIIKYLYQAGPAPCGYRP